MFFLGGEIAEIEDFEFAESDECAEGAGIFGLVGEWRSRVCAGGIGLACAGQSSFDERTVGRDNFDSNSLNRKNVARLGDDAFVFSSGKKLPIRQPVFLRDGIGGLAVFAVIDEGVDGNFCRELWGAANVVVVVVGDEDEVNFVDAGIMNGGDDPVGVAIIISRPAGVDEKGLSFLCDE